VTQPTGYPTPLPPEALDAPIISFLQFFIKEDHAFAFEKFMARIMREAREFPGCLWAYAYKAEDMSATYIVLSGWTDAETVVNFEEVPRHVRAARMGEEELFSRPMVMKRYKRFNED
jgi:quinol monooxygenase YgiN